MERSYGSNSVRERPRLESPRLRKCDSNSSKVLLIAVIIIIIIIIIMMMMMTTTTVTATTTTTRSTSIEQNRQLVENANDLLHALVT
jgi:cell division protein FtsL